jgi:hypothetical protein
MDGSGVFPLQSQKYAATAPYRITARMKRNMLVSIADNSSALLIKANRRNITTPLSRQEINLDSDYRNAPKINFLEHSPGWNFGKKPILYPPCIKVALKLSGE